MADVSAFGLIEHSSRAAAFDVDNLNIEDADAVVFAGSAGLAQPAHAAVVGRGGADCQRCGGTRLAAQCAAVDVTAAKAEPAWVRSVAGVASSRLCARLP